MANTTTFVDFGKLKDITLGEIYKEKYPRLIVPMTGVIGPIWDVIKKHDAKITKK